MEYKANAEGEDHVSSLIDDLYNEIMIMRVEIMNARKQSLKGLPQDEKDKRMEAMEEKEAVIIGVQKDFDSIVKTHTLYAKFKKATGKSINSNGFAEAAKRLHEMKSSVGRIVATVPTM